MFVLFHTVKTVAKQLVGQKAYLKELCIIAMFSSDCNMFSTHSIYLYL